MSIRVLLLRGINVGGKNRLPMKDLVADLESLGLERVRTYIQSGNATFDAPAPVAPALDAEIAETIEARHGFRPEVLVLGRDRLEAAVAANPYPEADAAPKTVHLFFLAYVPPSPDLDALEALRAPSERFHLAGDVFYLHAPDGIGRSKLASRAEKLLGVPATARNWRTVLKLREMAAAS